MTTWADPNAGWMYEWFDPVAGGNCGDLARYLAGDTAARFSEVHRPGPGQPAPNAKESHCIRPGTYSFEFEVGGKTFQVDYLQIARNANGAVIFVSNSTANVTENVEPQSYDTLHAWADFIAHVDLTAGAFQETRVVDVENAQADAYKTTFGDQANPSGTELDFFRFSAARSTSGWNLDSRAPMLSRLYWDYSTNKAIRTNYFDAHSFGQHIIRHHQFKDHVTTSRTATVALELMRPDEQPGDTLSVATRTVTISVTPPPPPPLRSSISGPDIINTSGSYSWRALASGGLPPYTYGAWYYYRSPGPEQQVGMGQSYQRTVVVESNAYIFRLRNVVTDQPGASFNAKYFVEVFSDGGALVAAGNGVRYADGTCRPRPTDQNEHQAWLEGLFDKGLTVEPCTLDDAS